MRQGTDDGRREGFIKRMLGAVQDYPFRVNSFLFFLLGVHVLLTKSESIPNIWHSLANDESGLLTLTATLASGSAILAGFAGVIVIYGLGNQSPRFIRYRVSAGDRLRANWTSISQSGFLSFVLCFVAGLFTVTTFKEVSVWLLEIAFLLSLHGIVRLLYLLQQLFKIQEKEDGLAVDREKTRNVFGD